MAFASPSLYPPLSTLPPGQRRTAASIASSDAFYPWQRSQQQWRHRQQQQLQQQSLLQPLQSLRPAPGLLWPTSQLQPQPHLPPWRTSWVPAGPPIHPSSDFFIPSGINRSTTDPLVPAAQPIIPTIQHLPQQFPSLLSLQPPLYGVAPPFIGSYPHTYAQPPLPVIPETNLPRPGKLKDILHEIPRFTYFSILLFIPLFYESRVVQVFHNVTLTENELSGFGQGLAPENTTQRQLSSSYTSWEQVKRSWSDFIDSVLKEWNALNIVSVLLLSAIYNVLQLGGSGSSLVQCTALMSLISALMSLVFGCLYVIRFETMRRPHKAMEWARDALASSKSLWNVFVLLALPFVWLAWSLILFIICLIAVIWQTSGHTTNVRGLAPLPLHVKIIVNVLLSIGIIQLLAIIIAFSSYDAKIDKKWGNRLSQLIHSAMANAPQNDLGRLWEDVQFQQAQQDVDHNASRNPNQTDSASTSQRPSLDQPTPAPSIVPSAPPPPPVPPSLNSPLLRRPTPARPSFPTTINPSHPRWRQTYFPPRQSPTLYLNPTPAPQRLPFEPPFSQEGRGQTEVEYPAQGVTPFVPPPPLPPLNWSPPLSPLQPFQQDLYTIAEGEGQEQSSEHSATPHRPNVWITTDHLSPRPLPSPAALSSGTTLVQNDSASELGNGQPQITWLAAYGDTIHPSQLLRQPSPYILSPLALGSSPPPEIRIVPSLPEDYGDSQTQYHLHSTIQPPESPTPPPPIPLPASPNIRDGAARDSHYLASPYEPYTTWNQSLAPPPETSSNTGRAYFTSASENNQ